MKISATVRFDRRKRLNTKGEGNVDIDVHYNSKRIFISTGISVTKNKWSKTKNIVVRSVHADEYNEKINYLLTKIKAFEFELLENGVAFNSENLKKFIARPKTGSADFIEFAERELERCDLAPSSIKTNQATINHFKTFSKQINRDIRFVDMDIELIEDFESYLKKSGLAQNTIYRSHKNIKKFINAAIKKKLMLSDNNPYLHFKTKAISSDRQALSFDEVKRLENLDLNGADKGLCLMRDMFLFSCYTGQRWSDVEDLSTSNIVKDGKITKVKYTMQKVDRPMELPLSKLFNGKPEKIINKYMPQEKGYIFPRISNQAANRLLKVLGLMIKTDKKMTFHVSRHTCGTMLAELSNNPFVIMQVLGHRDIKTSMIYIHLSQRNLEKQLDKLKWSE